MQSEELERLILLFYEILVFTHVFLGLVSIKGNYFVFRNVVLVGQGGAVDRLHPTHF